MVKGGVPVKKNFQNMIIVLMLAALVGCLLQISSLKKEMQNLRNNLGNKISNLENSLMNSTSYIETLLEKEASILAKAEWKYGGLNVEDYSAEIICRVTPKEYHPENTKVSIAFGDQEIPMELQNGDFVAKGFVPLFDETVVSKVMFYEGDIVRSEALEWAITPIYEYIPSISAHLSGSSTSNNGKDAYIWKSVDIMDVFIDQKFGTIHTESAALIRYLDGKEVERTKILLEGETQDSGIYYHNLDLEYEIPYGSVQELYLELEDERGLRYRTLVDYVEIDKNENYVKHGSAHDIGETTIYGMNGEELYRGFW